MRAGGDIAEHGGGAAREGRDADVALRNRRNRRLQRGAVARAQASIEHVDLRARGSRRLGKGYRHVRSLRGQLDVLLVAFAVRDLNGRHANIHLACSTETG
ncbi:MAG TPA: hypothetical protein VMT47_13175 [Polyangia bacterium]|nr:hypothetical protein [Polyangia bacterium]